MTETTKDYEKLLLAMGVELPPADFDTVLETCAESYNDTSDDYDDNEKPLEVVKVGEAELRAITANGDVYSTTAYLYMNNWHRFSHKVGFIHKNDEEEKYYEQDGYFYTSYGEAAEECIKSFYTHLYYDIKNENNT